METLVIIALVYVVITGAYHVWALYRDIVTRKDSKFFLSYYKLLMKRLVREETTHAEYEEESEVEDSLIGNAKGATHRVVTAFAYKEETGEDPQDPDGI